MTDQKNSQGTLSREQLQATLDQALASGSRTIDQQIRLILALSQLNNASSSAVPVAERLATTAEARIAALAGLKQILQGKQVQNLLRDSRQIQQEELQLSIAITLSSELAADRRPQVIQEMWQQINALENPGARSRLLFQLVPALSGDLDDSDKLSVTLMDTIQMAQTLESTEARVRSLVTLAGYLQMNMQVDLFTHIADEIDTTTNDNLRANAIIALAEKLPTFIEQQVLQATLRIKSPQERIRALTALARTASHDIHSTVRREAIKAITQIESEDERADAVIGFAAYLDNADEEDGYNELLEQALGVAVTLSRRHMRARVLVALAPHLTLDLQGEALAAVHSLSSERDRAILLAELAPTLPPNMLVASLAVAHTMREKDARVHALTILAHHAPEFARAQTILDALAAAQNLPQNYERVTALMALVDVLPPHLMDEAFSSALETANEIENESARARALSQLGQYLPHGLVDRALSLAYAIEDPQMRLNALIGLMPRMPDNKRTDALEHMLNAVNEMQLEYKRARALVSCAPHLTPDLIKKAIETADALEEPFDRVSSYIALAQNLPPDARPEIIDKAWGLIEGIEDGYDRSSAIAAIAPYMPKSADNDLAQMANRVLKDIYDDYDRASAINILANLLSKGKVMTSENRLNRFIVIREAFTSAIAVADQTGRLMHLRMGDPLWKTLDNDERYRLWQEIAPRLTVLPLADLLLCFSVLFPAISGFISPEQQKDIALILGLR